MKMIAKLIALILTVSVLICSLASCDALAENLGDILSAFGQADSENADVGSGGETDENGEQTPPVSDGGSENEGGTDEGGTEEDEGAKIPVIPSLDPRDYPDPYAEVNKEEFYASYEPAKDYIDAYYRTLHGLMSGSIETQDQYATLSEYRPSENGVYLKNTDT